MYGISAYKFEVNLRKYHIHGASGYGVSDHVVQVDGILVIEGSHHSASGIWYHASDAK